MASEINPNVDITATQSTDTEANGPVNMGSGGEVSFDALEGAGVAPNPSSKKLTTKSSKDERDAEEAAKKAKSPEAEVLDAKEVLDPKAPKKGEGASASPKEGEKAAAPTPTAEETAAAKSFKLKTLAGREVDVPVDAKVIKKIDGVDQEVSIKDALDQYAGKVAYDKRFTELDQRDKAWLADKTQTEEELGRVMAKAYDKDVFGAILEMAKIADLEPAPLFDALRETMMGDVREFMNMDDDQREAHFLRKENEFLRRSKESDSKSKADKQAQEELNQELASKRETLEVSDAELAKAEGFIRSNPEAYKAFDNPKGKIDLAYAINRMELAEAALGMIDPDYANDNDMVELASRKLQGFKGDAKAASSLVAQKLKLTSRGPVTQVLENLGKKVEQTKKLTGDDEDKAPQKAAKSTDDDVEFDPRGWDRI